jgi:hypothetical protein
MRAMKSAVLAAMGLAMAVGSARAQDTVVVKVPFNFMVRGQEFPAGRYDISRDGEILAIRGVDNRGKVFAITMPADGRDPERSEPALVFTRYENEYQLSEVWESDTEGFAIREPSEAPRHAKAQTASPDSAVVAPER